LQDPSRFRIPPRENAAHIGRPAHQHGTEPFGIGESMDQTAIGCRELTLQGPSSLLSLLEGAHECIELLTLLHRVD
jgi:hypothetical protein